MNRIIASLFIIVLIGCQADEHFFGTSELDVRGLVYFSEIHWSGTVMPDGTLSDRDDDFIEIRNNYETDLDIGGWTVQINGYPSMNIVIPKATVLKAGEFYTIGKHTNGAFIHFDLLAPELALPPSEFELELFDGGKKRSDAARFLLEKQVPGGVNLPGLRKSMVRLSDYFGAKNSLDSWDNFNAPVTGQRVRVAYSNSVFASPGDNLGEAGETSSDE